MARWLMKSELDVYPWSQLVKDNGTHWDGVRNYQARNFMRDSMKVGDLIYDDHYGQGIIIEIDEAGDHTINFIEVGKVGVLDSHMIQFVEVISASR